jgi:hypothetical protein
MQSTLLELVPELLAVVAYAVGTAVLTALAVVIEQFGFETLAAGEPMHAAWLIFMGVMALFFGPYALGYRHLLPSVRRLLAKLAA